MSLSRLSHAFHKVNCMRWGVYHGSLAAVLLTVTGGNWCFWLISWVKDCCHCWELIEINPLMTIVPPSWSQENSNFIPVEPFLVSPPLKLGKMARLWLFWPFVTGHSLDLHKVFEAVVDQSLMPTEGGGQIISPWARYPVRIRSS